MDVLILKVTERSYMMLCCDISQLKQYNGQFKLNKSVL